MKQNNRMRVLNLNKMDGNIISITNKKLQPFMYLKLSQSIGSKPIYGNCIAMLFSNAFSLGHGNRSLDGKSIKEQPDIA